MSEHTQEHGNRPSRREREATATSVTSEVVKPAIATMSADIKYKDGPELSIDVPRGYFAGEVQTDYTALLCDTLRLRQFCSTEGANAKSRADRLAKAVAANDTAGIAANQPFTAADYLKRWDDYKGPAIGDMQRLGSAERMRLEAGWSAWVAMVTEHNKAVDAGKNPVITKAGKAGVKVGYTVPSVKAKGEDDDTFKARREAAQALRASFIEKFLSLPQYAERVQIQMDRLLAERGKGKAEAGPVVDMAGDSLL